MRTSYIWCPTANALVPKGTEAAAHHHFVRGDITEFKSPIDGSVIGSRSKLRQHMKQHKVIPTAELCPKEQARKAAERHARLTGNTPAQRQERVEALKHAIDVARRGYK